MAWRCGWRCWRRCWAEGPRSHTQPPCARGNRAHEALLVRSFCAAKPVIGGVRLARLPFVHAHSLKPFRRGACQAATQRRQSAGAVAPHHRPKSGRLVLRVEAVGEALVGNRRKCVFAELTGAAGGSAPVQVATPAAKNAPAPRNAARPPVLQLQDITQPLPARETRIGCGAQRVEPPSPSPPPFDFISAASPAKGLPVAAAAGASPARFPLALSM